MKVLIVAGGKGTRLKDVTGDLPKPLVPFGESSLLEHLISRCVHYGFKEIHLLTGYNCEKIEEVIGNGSALGANVFHHPEPTPLGTAGSIKALEPLLSSGPFLVLYGDVFMDMDLARLANFHHAHNGDATLVTHPNDHPYDSDLIELDGDRVTGFLPKPRDQSIPQLNVVNAGAYILNPSILDHIPAGRALDLGRDIFPDCVDAGLPFFAYNTPEYLKDIGTPDRYHHVLNDYLSGRCASRRLDQSRRCVFLDRDGTLNYHRNFIFQPSEFELIPGSVEAVRLLNQNDWLCILTTNQPQIARGDLTVRGLTEVHKKMEHELGSGGAWLDSTYFCPHHPDSGFPGEVKELKGPCSCRKPASGMYEQAAQKFNIDLTQSWVVGDTTLDIAAAQNIGARSVLVHTGQAGSDGKFAVSPTHQATDLLEAVKIITSSI